MCARRISALRKKYEGDSSTAKKIATTALKQSQELYEHLLEDSKVNLISSTPKTFVAINQKDFTEDFYLSEEELDSYVDGFFAAINENSGKVVTELIDDGNGNITAKTQSLRELQEEFAQDQRMLDRLEGCVK